MRLWADLLACACKDTEKLWAKIETYQVSAFVFVLQISWILQGKQRVNHMKSTTWYMFCKILIC